MNPQSSLFPLGQATCAQNLLQIATGFYLYYENDVESRLPYEWRFLPGDQGSVYADSRSITGFYCHIGWDRRLNDLLDNRNIFVCPRDIYLPQRGPGVNPQDDTSYGFNRIFNGSILFSIERPSKTIIVRPTGSMHNGMSRGIHFFSNQNTYWGIQFLDSKRHDDNGHYLFADGHFESLLEEELNQPTNLFNP